MNLKQFNPVQREYSRLAPQYDRRWDFYVRATISETIKRLNLSGCKRILDIGCGTGVLLQALAEFAPDARLTGIDLSREMLHCARGKLHGAVRLTQGSAESIPFGNSRFDMVLSSNVFHFIRNPMKSLSEMHRILRPLGEVVVTDWCDDYLLCKVCDLYLRFFNRAHFKAYGTQECRYLLENAGFNEVGVEKYKINRLWGLMTAKGKKGEN